MATFGRTPTGADEVRQTYGAAGFMVEVPVFTGGRITARANESVLRAEAAAKAVEDLETQITRDVNVVWLASTTAQRKIDVTGALLKSATDAASDAHKTYSEAGVDKTGASDALSVPAKAAEFAGNAYERASDAVERAKETTTEAYDRARDVARRSVSSAVDGTRGLTRFMREEPMVLAGLGIALGALVGALLPATEIENRTMGEASDALKRDAKEAAREQWERGKDLAEEGWDEAKEAVHRTWDDAKDEAQKSWDDVKKDVGVDAQAGDTTSLQAPLVPSETKAERLADTTKPGLRSGS